MNQVVYLLLRRMRAPLLVLIAVYSITTLGMVLIPGIDAAGRPWRMDFFHAFYVISYTATTIGFGEVPYPFSDAQRLWMIFSIHITVIAWLYAIGKIFRLMQDPAFHQAVTEHAFARGVRLIKEPFYIVCGYGDTGSLLVRSLAQRNMRAVVVDINPDRISALELEDLHIYMPGLCADASLSVTLNEAGLLHPRCAGVVALTDSDEVNLKIAISTRLLHPGIQVICRAETKDAERNMASFGTRHIINPFDTFAARLALALHSPGTHLLHEWLTGVPDTPLPAPLYPPHGSWILCGYGRFGKAVYANLVKEGIAVVIIEADPVKTGCVDGCVVGRGTEADTLNTARVADAAGIVAGTDNDVNNLSITITARELNPRIFSVARQNRRDNNEIFQVARLDLVMQRSEIIARDILALLTTPLLNEFLELSRQQSNEWANQLVSRLSAFTNELVPDVWMVTIDPRMTPALSAALYEEGGVYLEVLLREPRDREQLLPCMTLLLRRGTQTLLTPDDKVSLHQGDQLLFCGVVGARERMQWTLQNHNVLRYLKNSEERPEGVVWRWVSQRFGQG
ncbi:MAG TPA: NAD-binding protein [Gammaproteobacteria bacterium]